MNNGICSKNKVWHPIKEKCIKKHSKAAKEIELINFLIKNQPKPEKVNRIKKILVQTGVTLVFLGVLTILVLNNNYLKGKIVGKIIDVKTIEKLMPIINNFTNRYNKLTAVVSSYFGNVSMNDIIAGVKAPFDYQLQLPKPIQNEIINNVNSSASKMDRAADKIALNVAVSMPGAWRQ